MTACVKRTSINSRFIAFYTAKAGFTIN